MFHPTEIFRLSKYPRHNVKFLKSIEHKKQPYPPPQENYRERESQQEKESDIEESEDEGEVWIHISVLVHF